MKNEGMRAAGESGQRRAIQHAHGGTMEGSFEEEVRLALKRAPWMAVSALVHGLAILILMQFDLGPEAAAADKVMVVTFTPPDVEVIEPPPQEPPPPVEPPKEKEEVVEDPTIVDDFRVEEWQPAENRSPLKAPFEGNSPNDVIGAGDGGGGGDGKYAPRGTGRGSGPATQFAVKRGLEWLDKHQDPGGFWDCDGFQSRCAANLCDGKGQALNDVGCTGLALLAFLGAGNTINTGPYRDDVRAGLKYLVSVQDPDDGCIGSKSGQHFMYGHALAALALVEGYHLSRFPELRQPAQRALDFISRARNPYKAWRYAYPPDGDNDVSVTGWMLFALFAGKDAALDVDDAAIEDGLAFIEEMTDPANGRTGYHEKGSFSAREPDDMDRWPADRAEAMSAVACLVRIFDAEDPERSPSIRDAANLMTAKPPRWDEAAGSIDYYYWYYGSYALFQLGGRDWERWSRAMEDTVVSHQRTDGDERGSWDPQPDPWGDNGGRVYSTAINTLCLEVYYRYDRIFGTR